MADLVLDRETAGYLALCSKKIKAHCQLMHPERFSRPFSPQHEQLFEVIDDWSKQKVLVLAHRGFGKTSIFNLAVASQVITFWDPERQAQISPFIVPVSATSTLAIMQSENLKSELTRNIRFRDVLGEIKSAGTFSKEEWELSSGIYVLPRGLGQQVRGLLHGNYRPGLIIVDDLENSESVGSKEQRDKVKEWFYGDLMNSVDRAAGNWRIFVVGTILHEASLLQDLREDPTWTVVDLPLCDEQYETRWVEFMSTADVKRLVEEYRAQGKLETFYREYMNIANPVEDAVFRTEMFHYYDEAEIANRTDIETVVIVDPAKTAKVHSDFTAIVAVGFSPIEHRFYIRDVVNKRLQHDEIFSEVFAMCQRLQTNTIGYEVTGLDMHITFPLFNEMQRRGLAYQLVELKAKRGEGEFSTRNRGKEGRIAALAPYYRMGQVFHNRACCGILEAQLLQFPKARFDDAMDATAYFPQMFAVGRRYFNNTDEVIGDDGNPLTDERALEHEYARLLESDEDPVFAGCI